ncbi:MAG TPA: DUF4249 domain-containing protein [Puia sp.]|jgi:hypothetical protein
MRLIPIRYTLLFVVIVLTASCRKVISLDLHNAAKRLVVEADVSNQAGGCQVLLSQTANFDADNDFPPVNGASVRISDNAGNTTTLTEASPGTYVAPSLVAQTGVTYHLLVVSNGDTVSAVSTVPEPVNFDNLYISEEQIFGSTYKLANVIYTDPADIGHYYQFVQWINGVKVKQIYTADNQLTAGRNQDVELYLDPNTKDKDKIKTGDTVTVEMQCLDEAAHAYWFSAEQSATGDNQNAVPSNPVSNLVGNALGYFSAHTSQTRTVQVP